MALLYYQLLIFRALVSVKLILPKHFLAACMGIAPKIFEEAQSKLLSAYATRVVIGM